MKLAAMPRTPAASSRAPSALVGALDQTLQVFAVDDHRVELLQRLGDAGGLIALLSEGEQRRRIAPGYAGYVIGLFGQGPIFLLEENFRATKGRAPHVAAAVN